MGITLARHKGREGSDSQDAPQRKKRLLWDRALLILEKGRQLLLGLRQKWHEKTKKRVL